MAIHFEELWEKCEQFHQPNDTEVSAPAVIEALSLKLDLYKAIDGVSEMSTEDIHQAKSRTLGEILMSLTQLSLKDNINVFDALQLALHYRNVEQLNKKHQ